MLRTCKSRKYSQNLRGVSIKVKYSDHLLVRCTHVRAANTSTNAQLVVPTGIDLILFQECFISHCGLHSVLPPSVRIQIKLPVFCLFFCYSLKNFDESISQKVRNRSYCSVCTHPPVCYHKLYMRSYLSSSIAPGVWSKDSRAMVNSSSDNTLQVVQGKLWRSQSMAVTKLTYMV